MTFLALKYPVIMYFIPNFSLYILLGLTNYHSLWLPKNKFVNLPLKYFGTWQIDF